MVSATRPTCYLVRAEHTDGRYATVSEHDTLRAARLHAATVTSPSVTVHRGYGPAGDRGIGEQVPTEAPARGRPRSPDATARRLRRTIRVSPEDLVIAASVAEHQGLDVAEVWRDAVRRWALELGL